MVQKENNSIFIGYIEKILPFQNVNYLITNVIEVLNNIISIHSLKKFSIECDESILIWDGASNGIEKLHLAVLLIDSIGSEHNVGNAFERNIFFPLPLMKYVPYIDELFREKKFAFY